jgi:anti-sigma factor RsiW
MNNINCQESVAMLALYADGELDLPRALALEKHLAGCASCTSALAAQRALGAAVRGVPYHRAPDGLRARLQQQLPFVPAPAITRRPRRNWAPWAGALAASIALAVLLNVVWVQQSAQSQLEDELVSGHGKFIRISKRDK